MTLQTTSFLMKKPGDLLTSNKNHGNERDNWRAAAFWIAKQKRLQCRRAIGPVEMWVEFGTLHPDTPHSIIDLLPTLDAICAGFANACVWETHEDGRVKRYDPILTNQVPPDSLKITLSWEDHDV